MPISIEASLPAPIFDVILFNLAFFQGTVPPWLELWQPASIRALQLPHRNEPMDS
jgi:hypothetical protein